MPRGRAYGDGRWHGRACWSQEVEVGQGHRKLMRRWEPAWTARFVTFSCEQRLQLLGNPLVRDVVVDSLFIARARFGFELFAWVIMPEHVHVLARSRDGASLGRALRAIKLGSSQRILSRWKELDAPVLSRIVRPDGRLRFWQKGGGFDRVVRDRTSFCKNVRYIHRNPVERGLVGTPEEWRWSSVHSWVGKWEGERACDEPLGAPELWEAWQGFM